MTNKLIIYKVTAFHFQLILRNMKHLMCSFIFFLLASLYSQDVYSQTILTVDYFRNSQKGGSASVSTKSILSKASSVHNNVAILSEVDYSIVGDNIPENGVTSAYTSHSFHIEGDGNQNITNGNWTFVLPSTDDSDTVVKQSVGNQSFLIDAVDNPNRYRINNGCICGKIIFTGAINGKSIKAEYNLTLELKPKIFYVDFTKNINDGYASYNVNCNVDYKGAESLYVSLEEEHSSLLRNQFVREPYLAHFSFNNISSNYYAWLDIKAENEYGSDTYTVELPPIDSTKTKLVIPERKENFTFIKVYNTGGLYLKTLKGLEETIYMPSGIYILNFYIGDKLMKSSKLLK